MSDAEHPPGWKPGPTVESLKGTGTETVPEQLRRKPGPKPKEEVQTKPPDEATREREEAQRQFFAARMHVASLLSRRLIFQPAPSRIDHEARKIYAENLTRALMSSADARRHLDVFKKGGVEVTLSDWIPQGLCVIMRRPGEVDVVKLEG